MKKLKKALSLSLALALSLAMAVPALAAGKTETYVDKEHNVTITMDGFLRKETHTYAVFRDEPVTLTIYVLADGSTIKIEAINGAEYAPSGYDMEEWAYFEGKDYGNYAWESGGLYVWANGVLDNRSGMGGLLEGPATGTVDKDEDGMVWVNCGYSIAWMNESDFAQLVPIDGKPTTPTDPTTPTAPVTPDAPGTYTVKKGDTWSSICINFYGTNAQRYALMKANKNVKLKEGAVITLPEKLGKDTLIPAPAAGAGEKLYTVKAGDTLGRIAAAEYGKAGEYKAIFERNADRLKNANTIYEGQVIVLPAKK